MSLIKKNKDKIVNFEFNKEYIKVITEKIGIKEKYQPVLDFMNSKISNFNFQSFIDKTKQHDDYRGENYNAVFPEFSDVLKEHGYQ